MMLKSKNAMKKYFRIIVIIVLFILLSFWWYLNIYNTYTIHFNSPLMHKKVFDQIERVRILSPNQKARLERKTVIHFEITDKNNPYNFNPGKYVSRIIGLPGEKVEMKESVVYINGQALDEPYTEEEVKPLPQNFSEIQVPLDSYLVIADDRSVLVKYFVKTENVLGFVIGL